MGSQAVGITSLWRQSHKEAADPPSRDQGLRVPHLPSPETLVSTEAEALGLSPPGGGKETERVRCQGVSGRVQQRRVCSLGPQVESEDLEFPGELLSVSGSLAVSWVTL